MGSKKPKKARHHEHAQTPQRQLPVALRLEHAVDALASSRHALDDFSSAGRNLIRCETDFANFVIHARRTTAMLNRLKGEAGYDDWWSPWADTLSSNALAQLFKDLRTTTEHGSTVKVPLKFQFTTPTQGSGFVQIEIHPTTHAVVVTDPVTGLVVPLDGNAFLTVDDARLPQEFRDTPIGELMARHLALLDSIVSSAIAQFTPPAEAPPDNA